MDWHDWLQHLDSLAWDSPEWDQAESFLQDAAKLVQRRRERMAHQAAELLGVLGDECREDLQYFDGLHLLDLPADGLAGETGQQLASLHTLLREFHEVKQQEQSNIRTARAVRSRLSDLEDAIEQHIEQITSRGGEAPPDCPAVEQAPLGASVNGDVPPVCPTVKQSPPGASSGVDELPACPTVESAPPAASAGGEGQSRPTAVASQRNEPASQAASRRSLDRERQRKLQRLKKDKRLLRPQTTPDGRVRGERGSYTEQSRREASELVERLLSPDELPEEEAEVSVVRAEAAVAGEPKAPSSLAAPPEVVVPERPEPNFQADATESTEASLEFLCRALETDDFAGAYWWLRSRESDGQPTGIPAWMAEALQVARWGPDQDLALADALAELARLHGASSAQAEQLLALAAGLIPALTQPMLNVNHWLEVDVGASHLRELAQGVRQFAERGLNLDLDEVDDRLSRTDAESRVKEAAADVAEWRQQVRTKTAGYQRATRVWQLLLDQSDQLGDMLDTAAADRRSQSSRAAELMKRFSRRADIVRRVHDLDAGSGKGRRDAIEGASLDQLVEWTFEACERVERWCRAVRNLERLQQPSSWHDQRIDALRSTVRLQLAPSVAELTSLASSGDSLLQAAVRVVLSALRRLTRLCRLEVPTELADVPLPASGAREMTAEAGDPHRRLAMRLWWLPEIQFEDRGEPTADALPRVWRALEADASSPRTRAQSLRAWFAQRDFRFTRMLLDQLEESDDWQLLNGEQDERLESVRHELDERKQELEQRLQYAIVDGVLSEGDRAELQAQLLELNNEELICFAPALEVCDQVEQHLGSAYQEETSRLSGRWRELRSVLLSPYSDEQRRELDQRMQAALDRREVRLAHEILSQLEAARTQGRPLDLMATPDVPDPLGEFVACHEVLLAAARERGPRSAEHYERLVRLAGAEDDLPAPRIEEACRALAAWDELRRRPLRKSESQASPRLVPLIEFFGLQPRERNLQIQIVADARNWARIRFEAGDGGRSVVPQFGSSQNGVYDLLCVWESPSAEGLLAILTEANLSRPTLVLYLGPLSLNQRSNMAQILNREKRSVIVIDDAILLFLARQRESRWPVLLRATLPYSCVNPYLPGSGKVPREMFFGRESMIAALADFSGSGSCLVYGGRQLGKSALLQRVQQRFHDPTQGQFAIYEDIRHLGDPLADKPPELVWSIIRDELNGRSTENDDSIPTFFERTVKADAPDTIVKHIRDRLAANSNLRLLILLDEADYFLAEDARGNFQHVTALKNLMERTDRRVKVVFAGLHNVQRFQSIPNQPFAHLGPPIEVGPLEGTAAMALVQEPLQALGYSFADESLVLKILSYTNFHPGLIHLFCRQLLEDLRGRQRRGNHRYSIDDQAIRAVYARAETQRHIRDRFNLTLQLDLRYSAIVWAIIVDQQDCGGGRSSVYAHARLRALLANWWPATFQEMPGDEFRGLLDELCGLGVLLHVPDGYRLRSPNLAHLVGDCQEIEQKLYELASKPALGNEDFNKRRKVLERTARRSPLTHQQSGELVRPQFGVGLVFGSPALGWTDLPPAITQLVPPGDKQDAVTRIMQVATDTDSVADWDHTLREFLEEHRQATRLVLLGSLTGDYSGLETLVRTSVEFCRKRERTERHWLRILLAFDPQAAWAWHLLPDTLRAELENAVAASVQLRRWDEVDMELHLKSLTPDRLVTVDVLQFLREATGGWPLLVDEVFTRCGDAADPRPVAAKLQGELDGDSEMRAKFLASLGLQSIPLSAQLLAVLRQFGTSTFEQEFLRLALLEAEFPEEVLTAVFSFLGQLTILERSGDNFQVNRQVAQVIAQP
ncbi:MAG: hypothetical protein J5I93_15090 [Pirellulaceae bacterium]|nr:hypothetical protein [Pirellulaceae bacterium]